MIEKNLYIFNRETGEYEICRPSWKSFFRKASAILAIGFAFFLSYYVICNHNQKNTVKTELLERRNKTMLSRIEHINAKFDAQSASLAELEMRDNLVYRPIFGMDDIPSAVRNAGMEASGKYASLENFLNARYIISSETKLDILSKKAYIQSLSFDYVESISKRAGDMAACVPAIIPVVPTSSIRYTSAFGYRVDPFNSSVRFHRGVDLAGPKGSNIYATGDGTIINVTYSRSGYGNIVEIDHGFGYVTRYGHLLSACVAVGQRVHRGDKIGELGNSGRSTAPHLHYEVIYRNKPVNPRNYYESNVTPEEYLKMIETTKTRTAE